MAYKDKLVAVVKCNGKVLRERKTSDGDMFITLPFGAEYTLKFKNLHSRRAVVQVQIDGTDVLHGHELVVDAHSETELEGFMKGNSAKSAFKFIQKTKEISDHRGDKLDDGMITISFAFEEPVAQTTWTITNTDPCPWRPKPWIEPWKPWTITWSQTTEPKNSGILRGETATLASNSSDGATTSCNIQATPTASCFYNSVVDEQATPDVDEGITVKGSDVDQSFYDVHVGAVGDYETIVLRLRGVSAEGQPVKKAVTTKTKLVCPTCGKRSRSHIKFCNNCGTNIQAA